MLTIEKTPGFILYPLTVILLAQATLITIIEFKLNKSDNIDDIKIISKVTNDFEFVSCRVEKQRMLRRAVITFSGRESSRKILYRLGKIDCQEFNSLISDITKNKVIIWVVKFGWYTNNVQLQVGHKVITSFDQYKERGNILPIWMLTIVAFLASFLKKKRIYNIGRFRL